MKPILSFSILVVAGFAAARADELPAIPFDAAKAKKVLEAKRSATLEVTLDAYKAVGKHKAEWDRLVERAMRDQVEGLHGPEWDRLVARGRSQELIKMAVESGCDDPMVRYLHAELSREPADNNAEQNAVLEEAVKNLAASKYPDIIKIDAWLALISACQGERLQDLDPDERKIVNAALDQTLKLLAKACANRKPHQRDQLIHMCQLVYKNGHQFGQGQKWFDRLRNEVFGTLERNDLVAHVVNGTYLIESAWEARGSGVASTVTPAQWREFRERLKDADERLTRAWELDSECAATAVAMIQVCMGRDRERDEMETWFRRAIEADPLNFAAFQAKMLYLYPWWHGSEKATLEFSRQIAKAGQWDYVLPTISLKAHCDLAGSNVAEYFRKHADIWKEVESIVEEIRKRYPKSASGASLYLYMAWQSERNAKQARDYVRAARDSGAGLPNGMFGSRADLAQALDWLKEKVEDGGKDE